MPPLEVAIATVPEFLRSYLDHAGCSNRGPCEGKAGGVGAGGATPMPLTVNVAEGVVPPPPLEAGTVMVPE